MPNHSTYLYALIVGCEVAFWLLLVLALFVRYLLQRDSLSRVLLLSLPAAYVGFTIAFGGILVEWADQRFAHRFAGGPPPVTSPTRGWPAVKCELALWLRCIVAAVITVALLIALIAYVDNEAKTKALYAWFSIAMGSVVMWFVFGPLWSLLFFRRSEAGR